MPTKLYNAEETKIRFVGSGGDVTMTFASTPNGIVAASDQWDRGANSRPGLYRWRCKLKLDSGASASSLQAVLYLAQTDDNVDIPGRLSAFDQELDASHSGNVTRNLGQSIGVVNADVNGVNAETYIATGICFIYFRYVTFVLKNNLDTALSATESDCYFELIPIPPEFQF